MTTNNKTGFNQWGDPQIRIDLCVSFLGKPMTVADLMEATEYCEAAVKRYVALLREAKKIHICGYRGNAMVYLIGNLADVPKPVKAKVGRGRRQGCGTWDREPVVVTVRRDPLDAAFFGEYRRAA